jgi:hypothetical protein
MFIGIKMLLAISGEPWFMELTGMDLGIHIPAWVSLLVILTVLSGAIVFSLFGPPPEEEDMPDREE